MKLYAVRDRLIDYYLRPFTAEDDKNVMASLSETINNAENKAPIAQTPSHFEIWRLAEIDQESGAVVPSKELLADCASLVRGDLRETLQQRGEAIDRAARGSQGQSGGARGNGAAHNPPVPRRVDPKGGTATQEGVGDTKRPGGAEREPVRDHAGGRDYKY